MKILWIPFIIMLAITGACNSNNNASKNNGEVQAPAEDVVTTTLTDLSAATDIKKLLCQNWEHKEDAEDAAASGGGGSMEMPYRGISFFNDGTVTENPRDRIRVGKWTMNDETKIIRLEFNGGVTVQYKLGAIGPKQLVLLNMADKKKTEYRSDAWAQIAPADDPFYPDNNEWRKKPTRSETDSEIKSRVKQAVLFYAKFLKDNAGRGGNSISFVGLPTCFKWYRGGISVVGKDKLEDKWINCFYNKEQAIKGQQLIDEIITKKYKWNKEESNWVMQSADVLRQMYDTLR